ncbi:MAG: hypothetical protein JHC38_09925 [Thiotrichales bacterium]|jgi:hypothetical protein|nr:hypothetical protein [Thiotrichales bacterium]
MSPALRHKQQYTGAVTVAPESATPETTSKIYGEDKFSQLKENLPSVLGMLKSLAGNEERTPYKKQLITQYKELAQHIMNSCEDWGRQDVLAYWLIWRLDVEGFAAVQPEMYEGIQRGLTTPVNYNRDWQTLYLTEMEAYYTEIAKTDKPIDVAPIEQAINDLVEGNMTATPEMKARIYKVYGHTLFETDPQKALLAYEKATLLEPNIGVKRRIEQLKAKLEKNDD